MKRGHPLRHWLVPIALLAIVGIGYGVMALKLGFYWDDWTIAWYIHFLGPTSFIKAFSFDRPLLAGVYILTTSIFGDTPISWQIFAIFARWLVCCLLWWTLKGIWPGRPLQTAGISILFALYPGFLQQHIAITYGNVFLVLSAYMASWGFMIWSLRWSHRKRVFFGISLLFSAYSVFTAEHFFGLELLRPIFIWIVLTDLIADVKSRLHQTLDRWLPFLAIDLLFLFWRISTPTPRAEITLIDRFNESPIKAIIKLSSTAVNDVYTAGIVAWKRIFEFSWLQAYSETVLQKFVLVTLGAAIVAALALSLVRQAYKSAEQTHSRRSWAIQAILLGVIALLVAGIPVWTTNLRIALNFPFDRFTLPMMLGSALFWVGIIELVNILPYQNILLVAGLAGLAASFHYQNALAFRADWLAQRDYFWQLTWRAPHIQPGTILLTSEMPFPFDWDNSLTAPLNWTYAPDLKGLELPYLMYNAEGRLSSGFPDLEETTEINEYLRITPFSGSISQALLLFFRPPGACVKLIDPKLDQSLPNKPRYFREILQFSDLSLILDDASAQAEPPQKFFGPMPELDWCYYFEKAELARQHGRWERIVELGDLAFRKKETFTRKNAHELLPFIDGYLRMGRWSDASNLSVQAYKSWENMSISVCRIWINAQTDNFLDTQGLNAFKKVQETIHCPNR